jgi:hypothetical protein
VKPKLDQRRYGKKQLILEPDPGVFQIKEKVGTRTGCYLKGAFTLDVKSVFNKNLGGILGGMQC